MSLQVKQNDSQKQVSITTSAGGTMIEQTCFSRQINFVPHFFPGQPQGTHDFVFGESYVPILSQQEDELLEHFCDYSQDERGSKMSIRSNLDHILVVSNTGPVPPTPVKIFRTLRSSPVCRVPLAQEDLELTGPSGLCPAGLVGISTIPSVGTNEAQTRA